MLKIAEYNKITGEKVDLKELEEFGFNLNENGLCYEKEFNADYFDEEENHSILVYVNGRGIVLDIMNNDYTYHSWNKELGGIEDTLYDLIQAGLVEKE